MGYKHIIREAVEDAQMTEFDDGNGGTYPYVIVPGFEGRGSSKLLASYVKGMREMLKPEIDKSNVFLTSEAKGFILVPYLSVLTGRDYLLARKRDYKISGQLDIKLKTKAYKESEKIAKEMHVVGLRTDDKILYIDDFCSSGGTACDTLDALSNNNYEVVGVGFLIERANGMQIVKDKVKELELKCPVKALVRFRLDNENRPFVERFYGDS